jgi:hypothetical protein
LDGGVNIAFETVSAAKQPPIATKTSQEKNDDTYINIAKGGPKG